jgi:copper chaperone CopZ
MKTLLSLVLAIPTMIVATTSAAQIKHKKTEAVALNGNCGMCKKTIETAAYVKKVSSAEWNKDTQTAVITYDSIKTSADAILKKIALAGYDNQNYFAPDAAYNKLEECCRYARRSAATAGHVNRKASAHSMTGNSRNNAAQTKEENLMFPVYTAYFGIKDALVKGDGKTAAARAKELFKAVDEVPMDKLPSDQHMVWMKYMKDISYNAEHIKSTTEVDHQREHFAKLSAAMYEVMKSIKPEYPVYYDHCPMYNDGKGANWLSRESGIKNPYYGSQMLSCGSTKETIK